MGESCWYILAKVDSMASFKSVYSKLFDLFLKLDSQGADMMYAFFEDGIPHEESYVISAEESTRLGREIVRVHGSENPFFHNLLGELIGCTLDLVGIQDGTEFRQQSAELLMSYAIDQTPKSGLKEDLAHSLFDELMSEQYIRNVVSGLIDVLVEIGTLGKIGRA